MASCISLALTDFAFAMIMCANKPTTFIQFHCTQRKRDIASERLNERIYNERTNGCRANERTNEQPSEFGVNDCAHGKDQEYVYDCDCDCDIYLPTYTHIALPMWWLHFIILNHCALCTHTNMWCFLRTQLTDVTSLSKHWHKLVSICLCVCVFAQMQAHQRSQRDKEQTKTVLQNVHDISYSIENELMNRKSKRRKKLDRNKWIKRREVKQITQHAKHVIFLSFVGSIQLA